VLDHPHNQESILIFSILAPGWCPGKQKEGREPQKDTMLLAAFVAWMKNAPIPNVSSDSLDIDC